MRSGKSESCTSCKQCEFWPKRNNNKKGESKEGEEEEGREEVNETGLWASSLTTQETSLADNGAVSETIIDPIDEETESMSTDEITRQSESQLVDSVITFK